MKEFDTSQACRRCDVVCGVAIPVVELSGSWIEFIDTRISIRGRTLLVKKSDDPEENLAIVKAAEQVMDIIEKSQS